MAQSAKSPLQKPSSQLALDLRTDSPLTGKVKGDRNLMVFNFFSLKSGRTETELPVYDRPVAKVL